MFAERPAQVDKAAALAALRPLLSDAGRRERMSQAARSRSHDARPSARGGR